MLVTGIPEEMLSPIYLTYLQDKFTTDSGTLAWAFFFRPGWFRPFKLPAWARCATGSVAPMMALGLAGAGIISLLMPRLPSILWLAVLYTLNSILWGVSEPAETAMVAELTGRQPRGRAYGLYEFVESLGFTIGPLLGGGCTT